MSEPIDVDSEGNPLTLMDVISVDDTIVDEIDLKIKVERLYEFLGNMKEGREREIIILRYGLYGNDFHTQRQVARRLGISRSYVSSRDYCKQHSESLVLQGFAHLVLFTLAVVLSAISPSGHSFF